MADVDDIRSFIEDAREVAYRNAVKEIELPVLRIRIPEPKVEECEPFTDDESPYQSSLDDFLGPSPMDELLDWLKGYPNVYVGVDERNGIFYLSGKKRTLRRMAKHRMHQVMLDTIMDMYDVYKVKILPLD